jgi:hypothetical protein
MTSFLRDPAVKKFDIIAIQEPWINAYANTTHHSLKDSHILIYPNPVEMKKDDGIKISAEKKTSKSSTRVDMIVWRSFDEET